MLTASTELRRKRWHDVSLQEVLDRYGTNSGGIDRLADEQPTPERLTMRETVLATLRRLVDEELTDTVLGAARRDKGDLHVHLV